MDIEILNLLVESIKKEKFEQNNITKEQTVPFLKELEKEFREKLELQYNLPFDIKDYITQSKKAINQFNKDNNKNLQFDNDFGKFNKERDKISKIAKELVIDSTVDYNKKTKIADMTLKKVGNSRTISSILYGMGPKDDYEFASFVDIMQHENNKDIEPVTGLTYQELKKRYVIEGLNKAKNVGVHFSKTESDLDYLEFYKDNMGSIALMAEVDANKLDTFFEEVGLDLNDKNNKDLADYYKEFTDYKKMLNGSVGFKNRIATLSNPLLPYCSEEDLAASTTLLVTYNSPLVEMKSDESSIIQQVDQKNILCESKKYLETQGLDYDYLKQVPKDNIQYLSKLTDVKIEDMKYYVDGKEVEVKDYTNDLGSLIVNGATVTIKDNNGRFLLNYEATPENLMKINCDGPILNIQDNANKVMEELKAEKFDLTGINKADSPTKALDEAIHKKGKEAIEKIDNKIQKEVDDKLKTMLKGLKEVNPKKLRAKDESYYNDIEDMIEGIINKEGPDGKKVDYHSNPEMYKDGLKSVRTFCQAYLDEKDGVKLSKEDKAKYKAINNLYTSLIGVEKEFQSVEKMRSEMSIELASMAHRDNKEILKEIEPLRTKEVEERRKQEELAKTGEDRKKLPISKEELNGKEKIVKNEEKVVEKAQVKEVEQVSKSQK